MPNLASKRNLASSEMSAIDATFMEPNGRGRRQSGPVIGALCQLATAFACLALVSSAAQGQSWHNRVFDSLESGRALGDYFQPFLNNYYTSALPSPQQAQTPNGNQNFNHQANQLLTPSTSSSPSMLTSANGAIISNSRPPSQAQAPSYDHSVTVAAPPAIPVAEQLVRQQPQAEQAQPAAATTTSSTTTSTTSTTRAPVPAKYQAEQEARDASGAPTAVAPPTGTSNEVERRAKDDPAAGQLSPAGKILGSLMEVQQGKSALNGSDSAPRQSSGQQADNRQSALNVGLQMLKARRQPPESQKSAVAVEQQIVSQHARAHHNHHIRRQNQHQRLAPSKHRDNKLMSALLGSYPNGDSTSSAGDARHSSALASLLGESLKSMGSTISSRSSIVKAAISDNKLSRTLSSVSKSIGGNKYVAGAGAAAALAALGLTVSKLLGPYMYSSSSKLADPLMTSGSYWAPSSPVLPAANPFSNNDRNLASYAVSSGAGGDPLLNSAATTSGLYQSAFGPRLPSYHSDPLAPASSLSPSSYLDGPTSVESQMALANFYSSQAGQPPASTGDSSPQYFMSYAPQQNANSLQARVKPSKPLTPSLVDNTSGHYANFYSSDDSPDQQAAAATGAFQHQTYGTYIAGQPLGGSGPAEQQQAASRYASTVTSGDQAGEQHPASGGQTGGELIMSSASSLDAPAFSQQVPKFYLPAPTASQQSRRSGPVVSIKLDEATRARLQQQLSSMQQQATWRSEQPALASYPSANKFADQSSSARAQAHARQQLIPLTGAADSSSDYATVARWTPSPSLESGGQFVPATSGNRLSPMNEQLNYARLVGTGSSDVQSAQTLGEEGQQIRQPQQQQSATYLIIRPKTNNSFEPLVRQQQTKSSLTGDNFYHYQPSAKPTTDTTSATGGGWRSVSAPSDHQLNTMAAGAAGAASGAAAAASEATIGKQTNAENDLAAVGGSPASFKEQQNLSSNENEQQESAASESSPMGLQRVSRTSPKALGGKTKQQQQRMLAKQRAQNQQDNFDYQHQQQASEALSDNENLAAANSDSVQQADPSSTMLMDSAMMNLIQLNGGNNAGGGGLHLQDADRNKQFEAQTAAATSAASSVESDNSNEGGAKSLAAQVDGIQLLSPSSLKRAKQQIGNNNGDSQQRRAAANGQQVVAEDIAPAKQQRQQQAILANQEQGKSASSQQQQGGGNDDDDQQGQHQQQETAARAFQNISVGVSHSVN